MPSRHFDRPFRLVGEIGHDQPEWPVTINRNRRSRSAGMGGHDAPKYPLGTVGSRLLALGDLFNPPLRRARLRAVDRFADQFRDINRRVCAESYALFYYTREFGADALMCELIGEEFAAMLSQCHLSIALGLPFDQDRRERLFQAFIEWEQSAIVGPLVDTAFAGFDWQPVLRLALRPRLKFAYFRTWYSLKFDNFASRAERIKMGVLVYRHAEEVGLPQVEAALLDSLAEARGTTSKVWERRSVALSKLGNS